MVEVNYPTIRPALIGIDPIMIANELRQLVEDLSFLQAFSSNDM